MISVVVQSVAGRPVWDRMQRVLEASDIGKHYERMVHPDGMPLDTFFLKTLERLYEADTELVIRFEDDVVHLNQHILHNAESWDKIHDPRFGAGWLLAVGGLTASLVENHIYKQYGQDTWRTEFTSCCSAVLMWRKDLPQLIDGCKEWFDQHRGWEDRMDWALWHAVIRAKKQICVHAPSLVDHDESVDSMLGHGFTHHELHTASGTFRKDWRRTSVETSD